MRKMIDFKCLFLQDWAEQPISFWNPLARHSSQIAKMILNDFVIRAERKPRNSPNKSSLLQLLYGFCDNRLILLSKSFFKCRYFWACFENSGRKYAL